MITDTQTLAGKSVRIASGEYSSGTTADGGRNLSIRPYVWLSLFLCIAAMIRIQTVDLLPLWVDEAESSINALSILLAGIPVDHYLEQPIYENTLVQRWDKHPEYEFKDLSYSRTGLALYHGWLPLYAIAGSFWLFGVQPDRSETESLIPRHDTLDRRRRTSAARVPSVVFGVVSILVLFFAGRSLGDWRTGLCAALTCTFLPFHIFISQQARYYSAAVALSALAGWLLWRTTRRGRWTDWIQSAFAFAALFHAHVVSFLILSVLLPINGVRLFRGRYAIRKSMLFITIISVLCVPWLVATEFVHHSRQIPRASRLFSLPGDLLIGPVALSEFSIAFAGGAFLAGLAVVPSRRESFLRLRKSFGRRACAYGFVMSWLIVGYFAFFFCVPAASFALMRLAVTLLTPAVLLLSLLVVTAAEFVWPKHPTAAMIVLSLVFVIGSHLARPLAGERQAADAWSDVEVALGYLSSRKLTRGTKIYASPNEHLVLTFYSGLPIQSVAPVRHTFFETYPGDVVYFEKTDLRPSVDSPGSAESLIRRASAARMALSSSDALEMSWQVVTLSQRRRLESVVRNFEPLEARLPAFAVDAASEHTRELVRNWDRRKYYNPMVRGFRIRTIYDWWTVYFYRFVDPVYRREHPAYLTRIANATASFLRGNWIVFYSPGQQRGRE